MKAGRADDEVSMALMQNLKLAYIDFDKFKHCSSVIEPHHLKKYFHVHHNNSSAIQNNNQG